MSIHEFNKPIPVVLQDGSEGWALYVKCSGMFENDEWCVVHCDGGHVRHYLSNQIKIYQNQTFDIAAEIVKTMINASPNDCILGEEIRKTFGDNIKTK
jgi:hypothetical protein